jgi:fatty acid desaturase
MRENTTIKGQELQGFRKNLKEQSFYASRLRKELPKYIFKPVPERLLWLLPHYIIIFFCGYCIFKIDYPLLSLFLSILVGHSLAVIFMVGHEVAHGSVIKNKSLIILLSSICFAQFGLYGKAFVSWHNCKHHHHTQHPFRDPDCFGKKQCLKNRYIQRITKWLPGSGSFLSYTFLFWFFSYYTLHIVWFQRNIFVNRREKIESRTYSIASYIVWIFISCYLHPLGLIYFFLIPLVVSNFTLMSYLSTNHFLSPLTEEINDPLANSLTVDTWKIFRILHLNFNYHIEHHVFPYVSAKYAPVISKLLKEKFSAKYNHMSHRKALKLLYQRPKFYYDDVTFINPVTQEKFPTIIIDELI